MPCSKVAKYILLLFSIILSLVGVALLGVGIWLLVDPALSGYVQIAGVRFYDGGAIILTTAGCLLFAFNFFGCVGAVKENSWLLSTYFVFLVIVFGLQVSVGVWALLSYDSLETTITTNMAELNVTNPDVQENLDSTQVKLHCCGTINGCEDWLNQPSPLASCACIDADLFNTTECETPPANCSAASSDYIYSQPCNEAVYLVLKDNSVVIGSCVLGLTLFEVIQMIMTMGLCCAFSEKK